MAARGDEVVMGGEAFDWMREAACLGKDQRFWYPEPEDVGQQGYKGKHLDEFVPPSAAAVCRMCDVQQDCLAWALAHEDDGVWAGTSPKARRRMRKQAGIRLRAPTVRARGAANFVDAPDPFDPPPEISTAITTSGPGRIQGSST